MLRHAEHVMGTVFSFAVRDPGPDTAAAVRRIVERLHRIDAVFSPYRPDSDISRLDRGETTLEACDPEVAQVLDRCREIAAETGGRFTERPHGRLDPSGWVKGWAVEEASRALRTAGSRDHSVSGGGDVQTAGGPWRIGIADPLRPGALAAVVTGRDLAVATSGPAERGDHIVDPVRGRPATGLASLTLVGRTLARTDALATAAFAMGPERAIEWVAAHPDVAGLAVHPDGRRERTPGFARHLAPADAGTWQLPAPLRTAG
ncbi:FAD:protein FMN transferase [Kitasatospora paracochleata]|uniref:FAD:protein FMN transferase n=1 Tax=Kitasatospora paracochleata TaxID=58354 RepID=A0ABT1IS64_9ACTN|nr:FAD:protein FMN transferase [Kitasatospora paracochleata]MCP2307972.1 thiamine biosynthesis lipoprotein [Kitasatospora paracochleata]